MRLELYRLNHPNSNINIAGINYVMFINVLTDSSAKKLRNTPANRYKTVRQIQTESDSSQAVKELFASNPTSENSKKADSMLMRTGKVIY